MGLPWVRLEAQFPTNPKILGLVEAQKWRAIAVYVFSLSYSGGHGTDGYLPALVLPFIHATKRDAATLVEAGLWNTCGQGGWEINGWTEFQMSSAEHEKRRERMRQRAEQRWSKEKLSGAHDA